MKRVGILTSGGDCQGLNATIRAVAKTLYNQLGNDVEIIGIIDGYRGLIYGETRKMKPENFSGILTMGGTILGTSRQPFKLMRVVDENSVDKVEAMKKNYKKLGLDCLVVLGGNGTQKTANLLREEGLNVVSLPKTIDNDLWGTDKTFGFQSAVDIATNVIDCIHSTATSHGRVFIIEVMGHKVGWLTLYAGIAGGADIVLIPEIALTYQTVRRFYARFGDKVSVINSRQSQGERYDQFKRAKKGEVQVMIGPRSALFTPFASLGLIIIDEEHEPSYKSESTPRYHARETAIRRAVLEHANVVMGSATPSVEAYSKAMNGEYSLVRLTTRYGSRPLPRVSIVDLREELKAGNRSVLSRELRQKMKGRFEKKEQVMLFLNRRGYAGFVSCRSCGHVMKCPHCDVSLSEHNNERLLCHYCGYETGKPRICPVCGSPYIGGFKAGTQQIEKVVREDFPEVRTLRMDFDTTRTKGSYEKILAAFAAHEADILIGTQMIVKGHDFPDVTLMGIVAADLSLNAEDYRCAERTFQLLCQAVGRGGRGEKPGEAVIQTYHPDHYSIQAAAVQDYQAFYEEEMSYRMLLDYPPAAHMLAVLGSGPEDEKLVQAMYYLKLYIERIYRENDLHIIGPAYASVGKVKDIYRQVIYLKHKDHKTLVHIKDQLEKYIEINSGFRKIYIQFDFS